MANTRETLGDQITLDSIVGDKLENYEDNGVTSIVNYGMAYCKNLQSVKLPNITSIGQYAFSGCTNLTTVDIGSGGAITINPYAFNGCTKLRHVFVRSTSKSTLSNINSFTGVAGSYKYIVVYVPSDLVATYTADSVWNQLTIKAIEDYPFYSAPKIDRDSWEDIVTNENYAQDYNIRDTKMIDFGTYGGIEFELIAFDLDDRADGEGKASMTWMCKNILTSHNMNSSDTNSNGWPNTVMRSWLRSDVWNQLPEVLRNNIVEVNKTYYDYTSKTTKTSVDTIWIPSAREISGASGGGNYTIENSGVDYTAKFTDNNSRIKKNNLGYNYSYWVRTAYYDNYKHFLHMQSNGTFYNHEASSSSGVVPGFCIQVSSTQTNNTDPTQYYGVEWDYSQTSPALTRTGLASGFSAPSPATSVSGTGSSPFDTVYPWKDMKVVNILEDGTVINKGEEGFSYTDNDTMVWIPEFYYKAVKDEENSKWYWSISQYPIDGFKVHPGSGRYIGRYHTSGSSAGVYSKSGVLPLVNTTQAQFRDWSNQKIGDGRWYMLDIATWSAVQILYLVEYANFNSQAMLGKGWNKGDKTSIGGTDSAVYHTLKVANAHNQYRWIEDPFSNVYDMIDGYLGDYTRVYIGTKNYKFNSTENSLEKTTLKLPFINATTDNGAIQGFGYDENFSFVFIPDTSVNKNYFQYVCDNCNYTTNFGLVSVGGCGLDRDMYGFFCLNPEKTSYTNTLTGSRLIKTLHE